MGPASSGLRPADVKRQQRQRLAVQRPPDLPPLFHLWPPLQVARCSKRYVHDWRACPFAHPTENARRRDPRLVSYLPIPCPDYKRGICMRGDTCPYSHGVYECWLHPAKYRTQLCKEGPHCRRPVCFFAHSVADLRQPAQMQPPLPGEEEAAAAVAAAAAMQQQQQPPGSAVAALAAAMAASGPQLSMAEEAANNMTLGEGGQRSGELAAALARAQAAGGAGSPSKDGGSSSPRGSAEANNAAGGSSGRGSAGSPAGSAAASEAGGSCGGGGGGGTHPATPGRLNSQDLPSQLAGGSAGGQGGEPSLAAVAAALEAQAAAARASLDGLPPAAAPGYAPRYSLDTRLATEHAGAAFDRHVSYDGGGGLPPGTAAAALASAGVGSSLPLNEQPFPPSGAPRMSNAVARKLGLAPQKSAAEARLAKMRAAAAAAGLPGPGRTSLDGLLQALQGRPSFEAAYSPQLAAAAAAGGGAYGGYGGGYAPPAGAGVDPGAISPALLSLVAANMGGPSQGGRPGRGLLRCRPHRSPAAPLPSSRPAPAARPPCPPSSDAGARAPTDRRRRGDGSPTVLAPGLAAGGRRQRARLGAWVRETLVRRGGDACGGRGGCNGCGRAAAAGGSRRRGGQAWPPAGARLVRRAHAARRRRRWAPIRPGPPWRLPPAAAGAAAGAAGRALLPADGPGRPRWRAGVGLRPCRAVPRRAASCAGAL